MFRPQATPYSSFAYGAPPPPTNNPNNISNHGGSDYNNFQHPASDQIRLSAHGGGPITFDQPIFSNVGVGSYGNLTQQHLNLPQRFANVAMETPAVGPDDLAAQEALARGYEPDLKGPLVGDKKSSHAITEEYAKADPVYVAKTARLPQTYSHYRPVLGDGNCGWRAIAFSYFESLQKMGRQDQIEEEEARMMSLASFIETCLGYEEWVFEDMKEEVLSLLRDLAALITTGPRSDTDALILQRFNEAEVSNAIVYYFRLLTSAYLKANAATYQDFIPDGHGVDNYCKNTLEPVNTEIEHLGMTLLIDVLLKPIGIAVEIVYLDRSEGTHVNTHIIQAEDASGIPLQLNAPMVHLLYRPGHYDMLYKDANASLSLRHQQLTASMPTNVQINRAAIMNHSLDPTPMQAFASYDLSAMAAIPGMSLGSMVGFPDAYAGINAYKSAVTPAYSLNTSIAPSDGTSVGVSPISAVPSHASNTPLFPSSALPIHGPAPTSRNHSISIASEIPGLPVNSNGLGQFRHSKYEFESDWNGGDAQTFQTSTFKNSHYNTAHYNNPQFQPEEWCPEDEERHGSGSGGSRRESGRKGSIA